MIERLKNLNAIHSRVNDFIENFDAKKLQESNDDKWSPHQNIDHLCYSLKRTNFGISKPMWLLQWKFGKCNRPERNYEETVAKYTSKLTTADPVFLKNNPFVGKYQDLNKKELLNEYKKEQRKFEKRISKLSEKNRSKTVIPHPLLGRITINEFIDFTSYHTTHHLEMIGFK